MNAFTIGLSEETEFAMQRNEGCCESEFENSREDSRAGLSVRFVRILSRPFFSVPAHCTSKTDSRL